MTNKLFIARSFSIRRQTKILAIMSILLLSASVAMFANDISETVQEEQQAQEKQLQQEKPQSPVNFKSDYEDYSLAEKMFARNNKVNPRNVEMVYLKYKSFIRKGIGLAVTGGGFSYVTAPAFFGAGGGFLLLSIPIAGAIFLAFGAIFEVVGILLQALCAIPFSKAGRLASGYKSIYHIKLKDAFDKQYYGYDPLLGMNSSESKEIKMAMSFGIK
ncbi:MAG: hypothetical protein J1G30_09530 [Spirochaetales bacterium]|nr:hypothetical protein [Spirochaetales bacterium]